MPLRRRSKVGRPKLIVAGFCCGGAVGGRIAGLPLPWSGRGAFGEAALGVLTFAAARLGTVQAAAHGVAETLVNLVFAVAVAVGQAVVPLVGRAAAAADIHAVRRSVRAGVVIAVVVVGGLAGLLAGFGRWILPVFSAEPAVRAQLAALLPLVAFVVLTDAVQAVYGFGMLGLRNTVPSLVSTAVFFGALCLAAVPVADAGGLNLLWSALACANLLQAGSKAVLFAREVNRWRDRSELGMMAA